MKKLLSQSTLLLSCALAMQSCSNDMSQQDPVVNQDASKIWPTLNIKVKQDPAVEQRVETILSGMTLEQKVAQTIQPEIRDISVEDMRRYGFGSFLNGGGAFPNNNKHAKAEDWITLAEDMYQASIDDSLDGSTIPTMWGTDAVHGHNNVIGATLFPHNIGLGAAHNPTLIKKIAQATAQEVLATGIDWVFAPTVAVVRDDRWGRTYEGYSEDPEIVRDYAAAIVEGLQGDVGVDFMDQQHVISTTKHFLGDGGTENGDDQGNNLASEQDLFDIHAQGYVGGLSAGTQTVMASFNSWHGIKNHGNKYLLTDVLKNQMGFDGLVVGDWNGHGQIKGCTNENCPQAMNAGLDIYMVPTDAWKPLMNNLIAQVKSGVIAQSRLDDAVRRILRVKVRAGLFDKPSPAHRQLAGNNEIIGSQAHREIARQAVRESLVLLKNKQHLLPLDPTQHFLIAGDGADNIGKQSGGWSITWQGTGNVNADFPDGSSIYDGIKQQVEQAGGSTELSISGEYRQKPDVAIVVFGEDPYAEGNGDIDNLEYQRGNKKDLALLRQLKADGIKVVSIFISGRPMWVNPELNASDAFIAAWLPGTEGSAIADVILNAAEQKPNYDFVGKLSFSWPKTPTQHANRFDPEYAPLLPYGFGLTYQDDNLLGDDLNETVQTTEGNQLSPMKLFSLTVQAPWELRINANQQTKAMTSSIVELPELSVKTTDYHVQEDALHMMWHNEAAVSLASNFPADLRPYQEKNASISFDLKLNQLPSSPITLSMQCENGCSKLLDLNTQLANVQVNQWQQISIPLACFSDVNFARVYSPFKLSSGAKTDITLSNIRIVPSEKSAETTHCPQ